jgi:hypothetical protein
LKLLPRSFFKTSKGKYVLIGTAAIAAGVLFYLLGFLFIQTIGLLAYVALFPAILIWERKNKDSAFQSPSLEDERWSKTKVELEKLEKRLGKTRDPLEKQKLLRSKISLENELRKSEWKIRESELTQLHNANRGLKPLNEDAKTLAKLAEANGEFSKKKETKYLSHVLTNVKEILQEEPKNSRNIPLNHIGYDLKAHYNILKRQSNNNTSILADYWVCWAAIQLLAKRSPVENKLSKYTSDSFRPEFSKFLKFVNSFENKGTIQSLDSVSKEPPTTSQGN